ncbi:MAG: hypothetical protein IJB65_00935 [Clostridia bacterium]|nr:hypothetical protein [Clostridia bacterium]
MDDKLQSVLGNKELMEKIAALVQGTQEAPPAPAPAPVPVQQSFSPSPIQGDKGLALLAALAPFLKESRRKKLDAARNAISVANAYKTMRKI